MLLVLGLPASGSGFTDALPFLGAGVTAGLGWFAAQFTGTAKLQREVNAALHSLMDELQTQHALDVARVSELNSETKQLRQIVQSLKSYIRRNGLTVPGEEIDAE